MVLLSFIDQPPFPVQCLILVVLGIVAGAFSNWAIYSWTWFLYRPISPWQAPHESESPRQGLDLIPIIGWPGRARDEELYGRLFWLRPMLIEIGMAILIPLLYFWLADGGLIAPGKQLSVTPEQTLAWFLLFFPFITLLLIGTFIDFDEHVIPDWVTIPGALYALLIAALFPASRLPEVIGGKTWQMVSVNYLSPNLGNTPFLPQDATTLAILIGIFVIWVWALLPKLSPFDVGWGRAVRFMFATVFRPRRKTKCDLRTTHRKMPTLSKVLFAILLAGVVGLCAAWALLGEENWHSLTGSMLGLAFGGGMIWAIRIVGTTAMGRQAMGFGDVTLMAMIGATLGWQATLLSFVFTIVLIVVFLVVQILVTGSQELAFGPYLCGGAVVLIYFWSSTWPGAANGVFSLGIYLVYILIAFPILMFLMLAGLQAFRAAVGGEEEE